MAKKTRKTSKALNKKKGAKKTAAVVKKRRKVAARKKSKPVAKKKPIAKKTLETKAPGRQDIRKPSPESFLHKIEGEFTAIADTLTDAERLHEKLDPGVSREPE